MSHAIQLDDNNIAIQHLRKTDKRLSKVFDVYPAQDRNVFHYQSTSKMADSLSISSTHDWSTLLIHTTGRLQRSMEKKMSIWSKHTHLLGTSAFSVSNALYSSSIIIRLW